MKYKKSDEFFKRLFEENAPTLDELAKLKRELEKYRTKEQRKVTERMSYTFYNRN
jgi:hypothetical protein